MTYEQAFEKMAKLYFRGKEFDNYNKASTKKPKYTKKYFDKVGKDYGIKEFGEDNA